MDFWLMNDGHQSLLFGIFYHCYAIKSFEYLVDISQIFNNSNYLFNCLYAQLHHLDIDQK
jgi:hypothetical protein